jgi:hypothetical protein
LRCVASPRTESFSVKIDPDNRILRTNHASDEEADIAKAATDIKYVHTAANSGSEQHPFGERSKQFGLFDKAVVLGARAAKRIVCIIH